MPIYDQDAIIRTGIWLYDNTVPTQVRIVRRPFTRGTGDYEDPPEISGDREVPCFALVWGIPGVNGAFQSNAEGGEYPTLELALEAADRLVPGVKWDTPIA